MSFGQLCDEKGCGAYADWQIGFVLRADPSWYPKVPSVPAWLGLYLCDEHKQAVRIDELMTDEGWAQLCEGFDQPRCVRPLRELTELQFRPVPKALMFPKGM